MYWPKKYYYISFAKKWLTIAINLDKIWWNWTVVSRIPHFLLFWKHEKICCFCFWRLLCAFYTFWSKYWPPAYIPMWSRHLIYCYCFLRELFICLLWTILDAPSVFTRNFRNLTIIGACTIKLSYEFFLLFIAQIYQELGKVCKINQLFWQKAKNPTTCEML